MASIALRKLFFVSAMGLVLAAIAGACSSPEYTVPSASEGSGGLATSTLGGGGMSGSASGSGGSGGTLPLATGGVAGSSTNTGGTTSDPTNCRSNQDCSTLEAARTCDTATGLCVQCLPGRTTCSPGQFCDFDKECHVGCDTASDCGTLACDVVTHRCTGCTSNSDCSLGTQCDAVTSTCVAGCKDSAACPTGFTCCANACVNLNLDEGNCGSCGTSCSRASADVQCFEASCVIKNCTDGHRDCNGRALDGCEADLLADASHCGSCANVCSESLVCRSGTCASAVCGQGFVDCDGLTSNGCETNIERDVLNCGSCASTCSTTYGTPSCTAGNCTMTCNSGWGDCDSNPNNGCEASLNTDAAHCGRCDVSCTNDHGGADCDAGKCVPSCGTGYADCDGVPANGCESALLTDASNCGKCGNLCSLPHATSTCTTGSCTVADCTPGWADCNGLAADGCEANLQADPLHCGTCEVACSGANGTPTCNAGQCAIKCATNFDDCDEVLSNGCEVDLTRTVKHCASCGHLCPDAPNGTATCDKSVCGVSSCVAPFGDCDGNSTNGCESNSKTDVDNCGGCGTACSLAHATATCTDGACAIGVCADGWQDCNGIIADGCEVNVKSSLTNCGGCGLACAPTNAVAACSAGVCSIASCNSGFQNCNLDVKDGCEINTLTNVNNCGACNSPCSAVHGTPSCGAGACNIVCALGYDNCDGDVSTGCETDTTTNASHCSACNKPCAPKNAVGVCQNSACAIGTCNPNFQDCDATYSTGCEINVTTDPANCGACRTSCNSSGGTPTCSPTGCGITCDTGYADCNTSVAGCETSLLTDKANCGGCGKVCSTTCTNGVCATPCTGYCSNPTVISISGPKTYSNLAGAVCYETTSTLTDGNCSSFATGRTVYVNGVAQNCNDWVVPAARVNGGYCIYAAAGLEAWAAITVW